MKGMDLLENMDLVDAAYVDAADSAHRKKIGNRWTAIAACFSVIMLLSGVMLGMALSEPPASRPEDVPSAVIDWDLYGVWVDTEGNVVDGQQPFRFSLECAIYDHGGTSATTLDYQFTFADGFRYEIKIPDNGKAFALAPRTTEYPYYISYGYIYDYQSVDYVFGYWALSLVEEAMILELDYSDGMQRDPGVYLLAFRDPDADTKEMLAYFQGFLDSYSPNGKHIVPPGIRDGAV